jgi:hypothetical protein
MASGPFWIQEKFPPFSFSSEEEAGSAKGGFLTEGDFDLTIE